MNKVIYLESDEEIINVIDRLKDIKDAHIALVVPSGAILLSSAVNLKLLMEESRKIHKKISIVTADSQGRNIAAQIGFTVYETLGDAREIKEKDIEEQEKTPVYHRKSEKRIEELETEEKDNDKESYTDFEEYEDNKDAPEEKAIDRTSAKDIRQDLWAPEELRKDTRPSVDRNKITRNPKFWIASVAGFIVVLFLLVFIFPKATVYLNIVAAPEDINIGFNLSTVAQSPDSGGKVTLLANWDVKEQEVSIELPATGKKNVGQKARGSVTVYNRSGKTVTIVAGTEFLTSDNKRFVIPAAIKVAGAFVSDFGELIAGKATGAIESVDGGSANNIGPGKFYIPALADTSGNLIYGQNEEALAGGDDKDAVVVSKEDIEAAKQKAKQAMEDKMVSSYGMDGEKIFVNGLAVAEEISQITDKKEGDEAAKFTIQLKDRFSFLTFSKKDFDKMFEDSLKTNISNEKVLVGTGYRGVKWEVSKFDKDKKTAEVLAKATILTATSINQDFLRSKIVTLSVQELRNVLSKYSEVQLDHVSFFPPLLLSSIPSNEKNVNIVVNYVEK